jgi:hypothetical protein
MASVVSCSKLPEVRDSIKCFARKGQIDVGNDGFLTANLIVARLRIMLHVSLHLLEFLGISQKSFPNQHPHLGIPAPCDAMPGAQAELLTISMFSATDLH